MQRYRFDYEEPAQPNGARPVFAKWLGGPSLAGVRDCPCSDGGRRTVYVQAEPDSFFSIPAACRIKGKYTRGFIHSDESGLQFHIYADQRTRAAKRRDEAKRAEFAARGYGCA